MKVALYYFFLKSSAGMQENNYTCDERVCQFYWLDPFWVTWEAFLILKI